MAYSFIIDYVKQRIRYLSPTEGTNVECVWKKIRRERANMLAPGNASRRTSSRRDTHKWDYTSFCQTNIVGRHLLLDANRLRNARVMAHFFSCFLLASFFPASLFPPFIYLVNLSADLRASLAIRLRFSISSFRGSRFLERDTSQPPSKKSTSKYASGLRDSALRSGRFRIMDRMDGRSRAASFFPDPQPPLPGATSL